MRDEFHTIEPSDITDNVFKLVGSDWMLVSAGDLIDFNTMTASWGGAGVLWNKNVCWCVIRPVRHTYKLVEASDRFTLCFFAEEHRPALKYCGTHSGRDVDKMAATGLTPLTTESGGVYFEQARLVLECRKIYHQDLDPARFLDPSINREYPDKDYHRMYFGEIVRSLTR